MPDNKIQVAGEGDILYFRRVVIGIFVQSQLSWHFCGKQLPLSPFKGYYILKESAFYD